ncbi:MAG: efflux RND transporter permease subunit [Gammaproteobacteria bacterium]|nr:MAG: efflux RND transporter permease subunit [Gammaproteobacteria bacterium]
MNLAKFAIENRALTYFVAALLVTAGAASFTTLGQLEDPEFTIKTAVIVTTYPGASPEQVELEVTDRIELALQELAEVKYLHSVSRAGLSTITVEIKPEFWADVLPQIWDEMRRKIRDIEGALPPGAGRPVISDDFGDVFGFQLAVVGDGYTYDELETHAKNLKKELSLVEGVARVDLWGNQSKVIYLDVKQSQLSQLGITDASVQVTLNQQNMVVDAGNIDVQDKRFRIAPTGEFDSPEDIANLTVRASLADEMGNLISAASGGGTAAGRSSELIRVRDFATVRRGHLEPPRWLMRLNGQQAVGISMTNVSGVNLVKVGKRIDARLAELNRLLPIGIEVHRVHWVSDVVDEAVTGFMISFGQALAIVLVVVAIGMGLRMGIIIGTALLGTILATFIVMAVFDIPLQRMSLGALIIALGMMVDNAIVVADGIAVRIAKGMDRKEAAIEAAQQPAMPLLGATIIAVMAFYPIFASTADAGEYCRTLFIVVGISLLASWVISMTLTPVQCLDMLPETKEADGEDPYGSGMFRAYRRVLEFSIRARLLTIGSLVVALVIAGAGFGRVEQLFFPASSMTKFMIDYWAPEGTRIEQVSADLKLAERHLLDDERVDSVAAYIGQGPPRFYLPVDPEQPYASYAQLIVNVHDFRQIDAMMAELDRWFSDNYPQAQVPMRKFGVGPSNTWKLEVRVSGPAVADPAVLRDVASRASEILDGSPLVGIHRNDWRERVQKVVPVYNEERGRWAVVSRDSLADSTKRAFDGLTVGLYREDDDLIPIVLRHVEEERKRVALGTLQVNSAVSTDTVPLDQVVDGVETLWEDPLIWRRDRRRTITIQGNPVQGKTFPALHATVAEEFDRLAESLPAGYTMEWGGELEDTADAQASLIPGAVPTGIIMALIVVALFNAFKSPIVIFLTVPFALIGIVGGLLVFNIPFGFVALLAAMSLAGMMIKNAIVLIDEIYLNLKRKMEPYEAVVQASLSRTRPVVLAAGTTVLGVIPLLQDGFWIGLAITIMAGLSFGTVLTLVLVPTLYATIYRIPSPA